MALLIGYDPAGLEAKVRRVIDDIIASIQVWAGKVDGINAAERLNELTTGVASLPTVPTGAGFIWYTPTAPTGYVLCDGSAISRTTYVNLFLLLGTTWGVGDGTNTFNVPDLRQRFPLGKAASGTGSTLAGTGGAIDHTHTGPSHTHTGPSHTHTGPSHTHTGPSHTHSVPGLAYSAATDSQGSHAHGWGATTTAVLTGAGFTAIGNDLQIGSDGAHTHTAAGTTSGDTSGASGTGATGAEGTGATGASGTGATGAEGTGATGTGNPPYLVINYVIKT